MSSNQFSTYYDGSSSMELSEEIAEGNEVHQNEEPASNEEWRRYIGTNPFVV